MAVDLVKIGSDQVVIGADNVVITVPETVTNAMPYRPEEPTQQSLIFRTSIQKSHSGLESRQALLTKPRQILRYKYLLDVEEARQFRAQLYNDTAQLWAVPLWHEPYVVTGTATFGTSTVTADFSDHDINGGQQIFIAPKDMSQRGEFQEVSSIVGSTLTISGSWGNTYTEGDRIYAAVNALIADNSVVRHPIAEGLSQVSLTFMVSDFYSAGGTGSSVNTYRSLVVIDKKPIVRGSVEERAFRNLSTVDYGAKFAVFSGLVRADLTRPYLFVAGYRADLQYWESVIDLLHGMREPFYIPTWRNDVILTNPLVGGEISFEVEKTPDLKTRWFDTGSSHQDIQLDTNLGLTYRRITSMQDNGDTVLVNLDTALPGGITVTNKISWLELVRQGSDEILLTHHDSYSIVRMMVRTTER